MPIKINKMATVKGQNLRILLNSETIAAALSCTLNVQLNVQQVSSKDDEGDFTRNLPMNLNWSLKSSAVVTTDTDRPNAPSITNMVGATVLVSFSLTSTDDNVTEQAPLCMLASIISDVNLAENRKRTTYEVTFTGKRNMLSNIRRLITADGHTITTASTLAAPHEEV